MGKITLPQVYIHEEDENGNCKCGDHQGTALKPLKVDMKVVDNVLHMDLNQYGSEPKLGDASDIHSVRVHIRGKAVSVYAIYNDPAKTAIMGCCTGSGCTCYASGCYC